MSWEQTSWKVFLCPRSEETRHSSTKLIEQAFGMTEVNCIEPFREPDIDGGEEIESLLTLALIAP